MAQVFVNNTAATRQFEPTKFGLPAAISGVDTAESTVARVRLAPAVSLASVNAGLVLIPADATDTITVLSVVVVVSGAWTGLTDVRISDTAASPVDVITIAQANLTNGARFTDTSSTGITYGAGYCTPLTPGAGLQIRKTGGTAAGGTSLLVRILYSTAS